MTVKSLTFIILVIYNFGFAAAEMMKSSSFAIFFHGLVVLLKVGFECINVK